MSIALEAALTSVATVVNADEHLDSMLPSRFFFHSTAMFFTLLHNDLVYAAAAFLFRPWRLAAFQVVMDMFFCLWVWEGLDSML